MFRLLFALFAVIGIAHPIYSQAPEKPKGRKVAFLVSVSDYRGTGLRSLESAETETNLLELSLKAVGYQRNDLVKISKRDVPAKELLEDRLNASTIIEQFEKTCKSLGPDDTLLFAFNGHCAKVEKFKENGYMLFPEGVRLASEESMIPLTKIYKILGDCKAKQKLVFLSPYRTDIVANETTGDRIGVLFASKIPEPPKSVILVSACGLFEQSQVSKDGTSPFWITLSEVFSQPSPTGRTTTGADLIRTLKMVVNASDVADFVKGDVKDFESWVLADGSSRSPLDWAAYATINRKVLFEKNEPVAVLLLAASRSKKTTYSVVNPISRQVLISEIVGDTSAELAGFSNDGKQFFLSTDQAATLIAGTKSSVVNNTVKHPFRVGTETITKACFSPDDEFFLSCDSGGNAIVWNLKEKKEVCLVKHKTPIKDACFLSVGSAFMTITDDKFVQGWSTTTGRRLWQLDLPSRLVAYSLSPDKARIIFACKDNELLVYNTLSGDKKLTNKVEVYSPSTVRFTPDGKDVIYLGWKNKYVWNSDSDEVTRTRYEDRIEGAAFSLDGTLFATVCEEGKIKVWTTNGKLVKTFDNQAWVSDLVFSPDRKKLVAILRHSEVRVWDIATGERLDKSLKKKDY